jgi:hypothetical protein
MDYIILMEKHKQAIFYIFWSISYIYRLIMYILYT